MAVSETQPAPCNFQLTSKSVAGVAELLHRSPQRVFVPVAIAEDPVDVELSQGLDRLHRRDVAAVDQCFGAP